MVEKSFVVSNGNYKKIGKLLSLPLKNLDRLILDFTALSPGALGYAQLIPLLYSIREHVPARWRKLRLRGFDQRFLRVQGVPPPERLEIEPTARCNLKCPYCSRTNRVLPRRPDLSLNGFKAILDSFDTAPQINLFGLGEPFLNKDFFLMIRYAKQRGSPRCVVSTNGCFITAANVPEICRGGLDELIVSIDGASAATYEMHRSGSRFKDICRNVRSLTEYKRSHRLAAPLITWQFIITSGNERDVPKVKTVAHYLGVDRVLFKSLGVDEQSRKYIPRNPEYRRIVSAAPRSVFCPHLWKKTAITSAGEMTMCCKFFSRIDAFRIGNVLDQGAAQLWNSAAYARYRRYILEGRKDELGCAAQCPSGEKAFLFSLPIRAREQRTDEVRHDA